MSYYDPEPPFDWTQTLVFITLIIVAISVVLVSGCSTTDMTRDESLAIVEVLKNDV